MIPFCIRATRFGENWQLCESRATNEPLEVLQLVVESPEFLGMLQPGGPMPRAAMVAPNSSSGRVVLAVDEQGRVTLVACPELTGEAELAALVGDLLATGGRFWHQPYEALAGPFEEVLGMSLEDWVGTLGGSGWSAEAFRAAVAKSLSQGRFPIVVLVPSLDKPIVDMLAYLQNMNLDVRALGYEYLRGAGVEVVTPRALGSEPKPASGPPPESEAAPRRPAAREEYTHVVPVGAPVVERDAGDYPPFDASGSSQQQREILEKLVRLDDLGLKRVGLEYFVPGEENRDEAEGTMVVSVDPGRWPMPESTEVIVVLNMGSDHLARFLRLSSQEIEEFLGSLPRVTRKEHKGCLLLRAASVQEATQLVNELRALREVASMG